MIDTLLEDRFRVRDRLVQQGVVEIYEGLDETTGQPVRVKWWGPPVTQDLDFIENWHAQLLSVQAIDDGHLPQIYAFGRTADGSLYQVEEPPHGVTLRRYSARRAPLSVGESVHLVAAAARAVGVAHREGVAHGGLTPETIYVEEDRGRPDTFITGWEWGEVLIALRHAGERLPERQARYLAPEQASEIVPPPTPTSDVYTLAAILYELLTGSLPTLPLDPSTPAPLAPPRRFNPDVPGAVERVLLRALSRDPAARQPHAQALASALVQALTAPEPVSPPTPPVVERTEVTIERRRPPLWAIVGAFFALLTLCLLASIAWQLRDEPAAPLLTAADATATAMADTVPNLVGPPYIRYNEAVQLAWNRGYVVSIAGFRDDPSLPSGVVVGQCPPAGTARGLPPAECQLPGQPPPGENTILVEVSSLPEPMVLRVVPDLYGQPEAEARQALQAGGLRLGIRREAYDSLVPAGGVVEQNPRRGLAVLPGTPVDIIVSAGPPPVGVEGGGIVPPPANPPVNPPADGTVEPGVPAPGVPTPDTGYPAPSTATAPLPTPLPSPTLPPSPSPTVGVADEPSGSTILLEDDFEDGNALGWTVEEGSGVDARINDGLFLLAIEEPGLFWKTQPNRVFDDYRYRALVELDEANLDPEGGAGIIFRVQDDTHFYFFQINGLGEYRLRARDGDEWVDLLDGWQSDDTVFPAGLLNELEVRTAGERLTLFINSKQVGVVDVPSEQFYESGDVGLAGESGTTPPLLAVFDDVVVAR